MAEHRREIVTVTVRAGAPHKKEVSDSLSRARSALEAWKLATVYATAVDSVAAMYVEEGDRLVPVKPAERFPSASSFRRALRNNDPLTLALAVEVLAALDAPGAAPIVETLLQGRRDVPLAARLHALASVRYCAPHLPLRIILKEVDADFGDALTRHPELKTSRQRLSLLKKTRAWSKHYLIDRKLMKWLLESLVVERYEGLVPSAVLQWRGHNLLSAGEALVTLGTRKALEGAASVLDDEIVAKRIGWDPHHGSVSLSLGARAVLAMEPEAAHARLRKYLSRRSVRSEVGAMVALALMSEALGQFAGDGHAVVMLSRSRPAPILRDLAFRRLLRQLVADPRLGVFARRCLAKGDA